MQGLQKGEHIHAGKDETVNAGLFKGAFKFCRPAGEIEMGGPCGFQGLCCCNSLLRINGIG